MAILLFIFFLIVFILMLVGGSILKKLKYAKKAVEEAADLREQRLRNETGRQRQQYSQRAQNVHSSQDTYSDQREEEEFQPEARRTQTATGETIIDNRHQERENKKIFDDSDGEYVEFEEA